MISLYHIQEMPTTPAFIAVLGHLTENHPQSKMNSVWEDLMSDNITIRLATLEDVPQLLPLIRTLVGMCGETPSPEDKMAQMIRRQIESDNHEYVVAESGGRIFGCMLVCYYLSTWAGAQYAMFQDFIVEEGWRNQGVGSTILAYARNRARLKECVRIDLIVHSSLEQAKEFFHRWGFRRIDREVMRMRITRPPTGSH